VVGARVTFSVIVPVRDDPGGLEIALNGLQEQVHAPDEVIIVNASEEPIPQPDVSTLPLRVAQPGRAFPGKARNIGARAATHEWLVFLDAGARPIPEWLENFRLAADRSPAAQVIFGCYVPNLRDEWDWAAAGVYLSPRSAPEQGSYPTAASLCVRRRFWESSGGMAEDLRAGEDLLFFRDLEARRVPTATAPGARVVWDLPSGPRAHHLRLRRYSAATWRTELARQWHWPLIRMYAVALAIAFATPMLHPALGAVVPILVAVRLARNYRRRKPGLPRPLTSTRALRLAIMTGLVDAATFLGIWDSLIERQPR
jgi:glycosyltransferase involved in cell wall biosynthesis